MQDRKRIISVIVGPTAVGKTALAIEAAAHFHTVIISADSRQCYKELNIGVAKPSAVQLAGIQHYFINSHSILEELNAAKFESLALNWANEIFENHEHAIMVGGTGLYIKAFCEGLDEIPDVDPLIRIEVQNGYRDHGLGWLHEKIKELDPEFLQKGEIQNPHRLMRALEVRISTGSTLHSFRNKKKQERIFSVKKFGIVLPKETLHKNINQRVDQMIESGLLEEVRSLVPYREFNALQTVGYSELFAHLDGHFSFDEAVDQIKKNTRLYAKRQMTWFKKDPSIQWIQTAELEKIIKS
jgi:tRNA dimethylallyltransferase